MTGADEVFSHRPRDPWYAHAPESVAIMMIHSEGIHARGTARAHLPSMI
jgi:hypothetical protein